MTTTRTTVTTRAAAAGALLLTLAACGQSTASVGATSGSASSTSSASAGSSASSSSSASDSSSTGPGSSHSASTSTTSRHRVTRPASAPITASAVTTAQPAPASLATGAAATPGNGAPVDLTKVTTPDGATRVGAGVAKEDLGDFVNGRELTFHYTASGLQHLYKAEGDDTIMASPNSESLTIDFGDKSDPVGADLGAMVCMPHSQLAPFSDKLQPASHTYAEPGTYTVTMTTYFCGDTGIEHKTAKKVVTIK